MTENPTKRGGLAWQKARRLLAPTGSQTRALEDWPESFTPDELAWLQYPHEGTDPEKRKARSNQAAMIRAIKAAIEQDAIETTQRKITVPIHKKVDAFLVNRPSRGIYRRTMPGEKVWVKAGEEAQEIQTITRQGCRQWLELEGETPSEHIGKWLGDALQTVAPNQGGKVEAKKEKIRAILGRIEKADPGFSRDAMPGRKADFQDLCKRLDRASFTVSPDTFSDYLPGLCAFLSGARKSDYYRDIADKLG